MIAAPSPFVVEAAALLPPGRALDLACGAGRHARYLASLGWRVVAVDKATDFPDALILDLEQLPLPFDDASFDLAVDILYFQRSLFAEVRRVLRPGGIFVAQPKTTGRFAAAPGELRSYFDDWEILRDDDGFIARHFIHSKT